MRYLPFLFMRDLILIQGKAKSSSYGLRNDSALYAECLAPGENCITCIPFSKNNSLKEMERIHYSHTHELHGNHMT